MGAVPMTGSATHTRIHDPRILILVRISWLAVFGLSLLLFIASIPNQFALFQTPCVASTCGIPSLTPEMAHNLQQAGISVTFYAAFWIVLESALTIPFLITSLVLFWRRSDDRMAVFVAVWMASLPGAISIGVTEFALGQPIWQVLESALWFIFVFFLILFLYLFPDARFVPRWTRWLSVPVFVFLVALVFIPGTPLSLETTPLDVVTHPTPIALFMVALIGLLIITGIGCQVYRYKHISTPTQRQQTKWVILGMAVSLTGWALLELLSFSLLQSASTSPIYGMFGLVTGVSFLILMPLTIAFSALHYRLWDVDFIINRSLVYGGLTVLLALGFVVDVLMFQHVLESLTGSIGSPVALGLYAVGVGMVFQPTRRFLQRRVDRHLFQLNIGLDQLEKPKFQLDNPGALTGVQFGPYQVLQPIGKGGMGEVYKGYQAALNREVAIKILPEQLAQNAEFRTRFEREARMVAVLKHPNIVSMYDFGEAAGKYYMVMELIDGQALSDYLRAVGKLSLDEVRYLVTDIASALDYAHAEGLVHRDVKPSNIMLQSMTTPTASFTHAGQNGNGVHLPLYPYRSILMDFGIAKILGSGTSITQTGMMGTLDYVSPEQIISAKEVDARADLYSLGIVVYQMLTGELPFSSENAARLVFAHLQQPPPDPRDILPDLPDSAARAILKALAKKPEDRFSTTSEFAAALE